MTQELLTRYKESKKRMKEENKEEEIRQFIQSHGLSISPFSFFFVSMQMKALGFDGIPYRDCKTLKAWNSEGKYIRKGEKSRISGVTWIKASYKNDAGEYEEDSASRLYSKEYKLFHRSQLK